MQGRALVHLTLLPEQGGKGMSGTARETAQHMGGSPEERPPSGMLKCILFSSAVVFPELIEHLLIQCAAGTELIFFTGSSRGYV